MSESLERSERIKKRCSKYINDRAAGTDFPEYFLKLDYKRLVEIPQGKFTTDYISQKVFKHFEPDSKRRLYFGQLFKTISGLEYAVIDGKMYVPKKRYLRTRDKTLAILETAKLTEVVKIDTEIYYSLPQKVSI